MLAELTEYLHRRAHREWGQAGSAIGMSHSEFEYLNAILAQESRKTDTDDHGQHLQDVVEDMGVRKASASTMVLKLEERGLVERVPCRFDARAQHILLTEKGRTLLEKGRGVYETVARALRADPEFDRLLRAVSTGRSSG